MFLAGPRARRWQAIGLGLLVVLAAAWWWQGRVEPYRHGGSAWGLAWGFLGLGLILLLCAFGARKRAYKSTLGTVEGWLQAHLVLGLVTVPVALCHSGLRFGDRLAVTTLLVMLAVVVSGLMGAFLYAFVPRRLTEAGANRTPEEISRQLNQIAGAMARLGTGRSPPFQRVYASEIGETTPKALAGWRLLLGRRRGRAPREEKAWQRLLGEVAVEEREELRRLLVMSRQRKELLAALLAQQYYRNWLDAWLWVHLPLSLALIVLVLVHGGLALYYRGL